MFTNKKREGMNRFVCDVSLFVAETPKASIKYHKPLLPIIPFGIVAYGFVRQPFSKQLYIFDMFNPLNPGDFAKKGFLGFLDILVARVALGCASSNSYASFVLSDSLRVAVPSPNREGGNVLSLPFFLRGRVRLHVS